MKTNFGILIPLTVAIVPAIGCQSENGLLIIDTDSTVENPGLPDLPDANDKDAQDIQNDGAVSDDTSQTDGVAQEDGNTLQTDADKLDTGPEKEADAIPDVAPEDAMDAALDAKTDVKEDTGAQEGCLVENNCDGANNLGEIRGESGQSGGTSPKTSVEYPNQVGSKWLKVRVVDVCNSNKCNDPISARITLTSQKNVQYELKAYLATDANSKACNDRTPQGQAVGAGTLSLNISWNRTDADDSRDVSILVKKLAEPCNESAAWNLKVEGGLQ